MRYKNINQLFRCLVVVCAGLLFPGHCLAQSEVSDSCESDIPQATVDESAGLRLGISDQWPDAPPRPYTGGGVTSVINGFTVSDQIDSPPLPAIIQADDYQGITDPYSLEPNYSHLLENQNVLAQPARKMDRPQTTWDREVSLARAGNPLCQSRRAALTYDNRYMGYFVGGGVPAGIKRNPFQGEPPLVNEGTWGVDYAPSYSRVALLWSHGRLYQGGKGQYEPDHKNRPFGQTFGRYFGNSDRRFHSPDHDMNIEH